MGAKQSCDRVSLYAWSPTAVRDTDLARAGPGPRVMPDADLVPAELVYPGFHDVPEFGVVSFDRSPKGNRAKVRHLDHGGQSAVDEERGLDNIWNLPVKSPFLVKLSGVGVERSALRRRIRLRRECARASPQYTNRKRASRAEPSGSEGVASRLRL